MSIKGATRLSQKYKNITLNIIKKAGHQLIFDNPQDIAAKMKEKVYNNKWFIEICLLDWYIHVMPFHLISFPMDDLINILFKDSLLASDLSLTEHFQDLLGFPIPYSTYDGFFEAK